MNISEVSVKFSGRDIAFRFPNSGNILDHISSIFSGKDYPFPPLPEGYRITTIVDIGANVGAAALWFLGAAPTARILCFEPARENYECLRHNLTGFAASEAYPVGLFSAEKTIPLYHGACQSMQHSIVQSCETGQMVEEITLRRASVELDRLGVDHISVLKIDTEGCEIPILEDLGRDRLARVDIIYLEWHSEEDRRHADHLLSENFILANVNAPAPHRGNVCYLNKALADRTPVIAALRIARPAP